MASELKIVISANASEATAELQKLQQQTDAFSTKSLAQLKTQLKNTQNDYLTGKASIESYERAQAQLTNAFSRVNNALLLGGNEAKAFNKIIKNSSDMIQYLNAYTRDSAYAESFEKAKAAAEEQAKAVQALIDKQKKLDEEARKTAQAEAEKKQQNFAVNKATAMGDTSALLQIDYNNLNKQLEEVLLREGKVTEEAKKLGSQMVKLKEQMDKAAKTDLATRMKNLAASFISAQAAVFLIQKAITVLKKVFTETAEAASHAEETANLFNTTFQNIQGTANKTANQLSSSLGLATSSAQEMLGLFGDLAMGYGQTQSAALEFADAAVKTGLDIISFKNLTGDTTEILQSMASGLAGNFENFRKWGIIVTQSEIKTRLAKKGLDKLTGSAYQYAKVQETLAIVQEKSKNATGDMAKTLESTENINRRLKEANKELMESIGSGVNEFLNPLKKMWLDIADQINKANKAQKEYAKGSKDINVYDINNNKKDAKVFKKDVTQTIQQASADRPLDLTSDYIVEQLKPLMTIYSASVEDMSDIIKKQAVSLGLNFEEIIQGLQEYKSQLDSEIESLKNLEIRTSTIEDLSSATQNFIDELNSIQGVSTNAKALTPSSGAWAESEAGVKGFQTVLSREMNDAIRDAIRSINSEDWSSFVDPTKLALNEVSESDGLTSKLEQVAKVYELVYNEHLKDGELTKDELKDLEKIAEVYKNVNARQSQLTAINTATSSFSSTSKSMAADTATLDMSDLDKSLYSLKSQFDSLYPSLDANTEEAKKLKTAYDDAIKNTTAYYEALEKKSALEEVTQKIKDISSQSEAMAENLATLDMSDLDKSLYSLKSQFDSLYPSLDANTEEAKKLKKAYDDAVKNTKAYYKALERESLITGVKERKEDYQESYRSAVDELFHSIKYYEMDDRDIALYKVRIDYFGKERDVLSGLVNDYYDLVDAEKSQQEQLDMLNTVYGSLGEFGQVMSLISGASGDWVSLVMNLASQLDVVQPLLSVITDEILPVLNAFLEPLLPAIEVLADLLMTLLNSVLIPFFPVLKMIAWVATFCMYSVKIAFEFIQDVIKRVCGVISLWVLNLWNGIVRTLKKINIFGWKPFSGMKEANTSEVQKMANTDVFGNLNKNTEEMNQKLADIAGMTMDIKDNTDSKNNEQLKAYNELFHSGILSESEYLARVSALNGKNYDNVHSYEGADYYRGAGGNTNVSYGGVSISINGGNYDAKELAKEVAKVLQQQTRAGSAAY